jgi:hypothetical protein
LKSAERILTEAADAARLLGGLFVLLGGLPVLFAGFSFIRGFLAQLLAVTDGLILIGPGVWYVLAARMMRRRQLWVVVPSLRVAAGQLLAVFVTLGLGIAFVVGRRSRFQVIVVPAILMIYFVPAVFAMTYHLWRLKQVIPLLAMPGKAFEPVRVQRTEAREEPKRESAQQE